ncbi:hypothetical protein AAL_05685 [Moelleriella libera RCEF 2490]|uniref:Uncharacterized protein n=1 Tax=Moelleriella libera RCEF 2490 TaxID=1081109 RepID=A0A166NYK0_9HYPO|nr:hypothetical protein AAL_05685 [Moelleriella libera RCEF 2490]
MREFLTFPTQPVATEADSPLLPTNSYHWALLSGPKNVSKAGFQHVMYHVKDKIVVRNEQSEASRVWEYAAESDRTSMLLVRIMVAKVSDTRRLESILRKVPLHADRTEWNSVAWVREALHLAGNEPGTLHPRVKDWEAIRDMAMWYVEQKKAEHRFDGLGHFDASKPATWDMIQGKEITF